MIHILSEKSVIYNHTADDKSDDDGVVRSDGGSIYLPNYPKLSPDTKYFLPLIGSLSNTSPVSKSKDSKYVSSLPHNQFLTILRTQKEFIVIILYFRVYIGPRIYSMVTYSLVSSSNFKTMTFQSL